MAEWASGNIFIREMRFEKAGDVVQGHSHNFHHTTIVHRGSVRVVKTRPLFDKDNQPVLDKAGEPQRVEIARKDFTAPAHLLIEANCWHEITALEDHTVAWCIYSHRDPQGEIVQEWDGWADAYR